MSFIDLPKQLMDAGYFVYPVSVQLDEKGKKRPRFEGNWSTGSRRNTNVASLIEFDKGLPGLVIDCEKSGIVVIDVDVHGGYSGSVNLEAAGIELPDSPMKVATWSGGEHRFFRQPDPPLASSQGLPVANVDIRGLGGIVFGPGTVVHNHRGEWVGGYVANRLIPVSHLPVLPSGFVAAVEGARKRSDPSESTLAPYTGELSEHQERVLENWLDADLEAIANAVSGERHRVLLAKSAKVVDRAVKLGHTVDDAVTMIREAYQASGGDEWEEKRKVVEWAIDRVAEEPMGVPEDPIDPDEIRFEEAVRREVAKGRITQEAKRRLARDDSVVDLGRELDFDEPPDGLFGKFWVDGVLPAGETVLLFGERNVGKSFVAIDLGLCVAAGIRWHGRSVTQGRVLYLAGEGAIGLPSRRRSWVAHHGVAVPESFSLRDSIVSLNNPASLRAWQQVIVEGGYDLVIVDTVRRAGRGLEMESPGDAQELIALLDDLRSGRHGCTVLALGHPTKSDPMQPAGAGTVQDALPMIHRLSRDGEGDATIVDMTTTKAKDGPTGHLASFAHRRIGESLVFVDHGPSEDDDDRRRREDERWYGG